MKRLSVKNAILNVLEDTGHVIDYNLATRYAKYVEGKINSKRGLLIKGFKQTVSNYRITVPDDFVKAVVILEGDYLDEVLKMDEYYMSYYLNSYTDEDTDVEHYWISLNTSALDHVIWEEYGNHIVFPSTYEDKEVTVQYKAYEFDLEGSLIVNESHIKAIERYLKYKIASRYKWNYLKQGKLLRQEHRILVEEEKREYARALRDAIAEDSKISNKEIYDLWNGRI